MKEEEKTRKIIMDALKSLPDKFALREVKRNLQMALNSLIYVEKKTHKIDQVKKEEDKKIAKIPLVGNNAQAALSVIDNMIKEEMEILKKLKEAKVRKNNPEIFLG